MPRDASAVIGNAPVLPKRPETPEQRSRLVEGSRGRRIQPEKIPRIGDTGVGEVQRQRRQVGLEDLGRVTGQEGRVLGGRPEAIADARRLPPGPPPTLVSGGA